jgi:ABC-type glycerol-3-phosphate transport system substrate-binding protein
MDAALYQLSDALLNLSPLLAADLDTEKMIAEFLVQDQLGGEQLGIPMSRAAAAMYVNLDALRDLGYENPPQRVDALGEMACASHAQSGLPSVVGFDVPLDASYLLAFLFPHTVYEAGRFDFAPLEKSILWLKDLLARGCVRLSINEAFSPQNRFASGQSLFYFDSTSAEFYIADAIGFFNAEPFDLGILPIPAQDALVSNWTGPSLSIFRSDPVQEAAAWAWIRWLLEPAQVERWARLNHTVPIWEDVVNPEMAVFQSGVWMAEPHFAGYDVIRDEMVFAVRDILMGADADARLSDLTTTANQIRDAFVQE